MFDPSDDYESNRMISEMIGKETCYEKLKYVLQLLYSVEPDMKQNFYKETIAVENWLSNLDLMREIRMRDAIVKDYPAEYFGKDYGYDDPFIYLESTEKKIIKIELYLMGILGRIISMMKMRQINIGDEV